MVRFRPNGAGTSRSRSLRWQLPALICALFLLALTTVLYAAYREVEATLLQAAGDRARNASEQVATLFARSTQQALEQLQRAASAPAVREYLNAPTAEDLAAARAALAPLAAANGLRRVTVWNAVGTRMLEVEAPTPGGAQWTLPLATSPTNAGASPLHAVDDHVYTDMGAVVYGAPPAAGGAAPRLGSLGVRGVIAVSPPDALNRLVGTDARIEFGNRGGPVWTDLVHVVPAPAIDLQSPGVADYRTAGGEWRLGALGDLRGTPWAVWIDFSRASLVAPARVFIERMVAFGMVVAFLTAVLVRLLTERITTPLADMTAAAEAIADGDYSRRVPSVRSDEIGRLGRAFNAMTEGVAQVYRRLEQRVQDRTHELNDALRTVSQRSRDRDVYLATIVESSDDAIIGKDLNSIVLSWNESAEKLFGYPAGEMIGTSIMRLIPPDRPHEEDYILGRINRGERVEPFETQRRTKDGRLIDVSISASPIKDATGAIVGVSKVARDITERKREQAARQASDARYRTLFEYAPDGIVIADAESYYLDANPSVCRMLGYARKEIIGLRAADIVAPVEIDHIEPALDTIKEGSAYNREWQLRRKDGSVFAADVIATLMPDGNLLGMIRDVTERNQALDALRTTEERMRFALDSADVGIWDMDYTTGVLRWSETIEAHYGIPPGTFSGTFEAFMERVHPDDRAMVLETLGSAMKSGADFSLQNRSIWPDGTVRWLTGAGRILLGEDGTPVRGVGISLDITERRSLEDQYQQAQKMQAIGQLAGGVAHDFNNLLTVILGFCELLLDGFDSSDPRRADLQEIQTAGVRGAGLTRQLLAFSRKEIIEPRLLDLNTVVTDMRPMLGRLIREDVNVVLALQPALTAVKADRGQVEQIILNLAVNAHDAMPAGGTLTIETANVELDQNYQETHLDAKPGAYVVLTVTDTGTGISPEVQARLFEPFFTTKEPGKGTGLGLATVHGIVARNGGSVGVYSEVGKGTSFKVYFPRADATETVVEPPEPEHREDRGTHTVLVVEDAEALREAAKRLLQRQGYTVLVAANALEAVRLFETHPSIDVLLTDVVMPGATGPELTRELVERRSTLRVVYMSGYTDDAIVRHGILEPGVIFLNKPFTSETLGRKIREAIDRGGSAPVHPM